MAKPDQVVELAVLQEQTKTLNLGLNSVFPKIEEVSKTIKSIDEKLITRIVDLEKENLVNKSKIDNLISYKDTSDKRIKDLENYKSYYKGAIATIVALFMLLIGLYAKGLISI